MDLEPCGTARSRLAPTRGLPAEVARKLAEADLGPEVAFLCWQLSAYAGTLDESNRARLASLVADLLIAVDQGSTRLPVDAEGAALLARASDIVGGPGVRKPLVLEPDPAAAGAAFVYPQRLFAAETRVAAAVAARRGTPPPALSTAGSPTAADSALAAIATSSVPSLSDEQLTAIRAAAGRCLTVVTGGPGTGKTTVVLALLRVFVAMGGDPATIALCAPTGKAANRLEESIRAGLDRLPAEVADGLRWARALRPSTVHRLLGYSPGRRRFAHHEGSRLPHRMVVVDEGSMVDLALMDRLFAAVAPEALLVLLGDADQLPSVEAGAVFRDLAGAGVGVRLTASHRQDPRDPAGQRILASAARVLAGDPDLPASVIDRPSPADLEFAGTERIERSELPGLLDRWYERLATAPGLDHVRQTTLLFADGRFSPEDEAGLDALLDHHQRRRCLAVTRGRPTGVGALNAALHQRFLDAAGGTPSHTARGPAVIAVPGEPVMMLRNDYERSLWNGDQGLVVRVREPGRPVRFAAAFKVSGRWVAFGLESLQDDLSLAFATTVHKAQGSEHDEVLLVLPDAPIPLLTRELIYTAITRGRRSVVIAGAIPVLRAGLLRRTLRSSGIPARLGTGLVR